MKLKLKNVGKIERAEIELQGITVIAGENNTGKSTIGKVLFCIFDSFYRINEQIKMERRNSISRAISSYCYEQTNEESFRLDIVSLVNSLMDRCVSAACNPEWVEKELKNFFKRVEPRILMHSSDMSMQSLARRISGYLNVSDVEIQKNILQKRLQAEFGMNIGYVNTPEEQTDISLDIKGNKIAFSVFENKKIIVENYMNLIKEICYIDDPFVLDELASEWRLIWGFSDEYDHRSNLLTKLIKSRKASEFGVLDEVLVNQRLTRIFEAMGSVCEGELISSEEGRRYAYRAKGLQGELSISSLSTGIKSFVILRTLLQNGSIDENGIIIMDEPEIHLHPEWQLRFAEIIVLIQKEFGANILLNTHSPYFLNAIQVFSKKYGNDDRCRYYLTSESGNRVSVSDVSDNLETIYDKLARPLQELENLEYSYGNTNE